jgi:hypothetical protein
MWYRPIYFRWTAGLITVLLVLMMLPPAPAKADLEVAAPFQNYYATHQGIRVLGYPVSQLINVNSFPTQYFEKGRIEDHRAADTSRDWQFMYGRLTAELVEQGAHSSVNSTSMTYADLRQAAEPGYRQTPPAGFINGVQRVQDGMFVPYDMYLRYASGYVVPDYFWNYINRSVLFPGGWLHDMGLPMTRAFTVETIKFGMHRTIVTQAFERSVLTYDPQNPPDWQVERGNIGTDAYQLLPPNVSVEIPAANAEVTVPVHMLARIGQAGDQVTAQLRWRDGTSLLRSYTLLRGENGRGLLIGNLDWGAIPQPPQPPSQPATLEIRNSDGKLLTSQALTVLSPNDTTTQEVILYWLVVRDAPTIVSYKTHIPQTSNAALAAIQELLWGPPAPTNIGYSTAIPTPQQVLDYSGRTADWGPRVTLLSLDIKDGVAIANFSKELRAYGGGSLRAQLITEQITSTLEQFSGIQRVRIAIEGEIDALQPWTSKWSNS